MPAEYTIGIDFGTTNSVMALTDDGGHVRLLPNAEGALATPSVVALTADGGALVGMAAKRQAVTNAEFTVRAVKLKLGTDWSIRRGTIQYTAERIAALILTKLRADAAAHLGSPPTGAVLTVPATFDHVQREALVDAARQAGIDVLRVINEPTAASVAYGLHRTDDQTVLVFDLGGGTLDVSVIEVGDGVVEVLATAGDDTLGGEDWDGRIVDEVARRIRRRHDVDVRRDAAALQRLQEAAEAAKIELSATESAALVLPYLATGRAGPVHVEETLTRAEFEDLTRDLLDRCATLIRSVCADADVSVTGMDDVVLVGGATRMPAVARVVRDLTNRPPYRKLLAEGVAAGAALQAGVLTGAVQDVLLLDVVAYSIGIEVHGEAFLPLVTRNSTLPVAHTVVVTTGADDQAALLIRVLQGDRPSASDDTVLGAFVFTGIPPAPAGVPRIEVTIDLDANGVVRVTAKDRDTGRAGSLTVDSGSIREATAAGAPDPALLPHPPAPPEPSEGQ